MKKKFILMVAVTCFLLAASLSLAKGQEKKIPREKCYIRAEAGSGSFGPWTGLPGTNFYSYQDLLYARPAIQTDVFQNWYPYAAEEWHWVDDKTFEMILRPEAHFQDGSPITAEDVVYSWSILGDPKINPGSGFVGFWNTFVKGAEAVDKRTIRVHFSENALPRTRRKYQLLGTPIYDDKVWKSLIEKHGKTYIAENFEPYEHMENLNYSGPYKWYLVREKAVYVKRIENWWGSEIGWHPTPEYYKQTFTGSSDINLRLFKDGKAETNSDTAPKVSMKWIKNHTNILTAWNVEADTKPEMTKYNLAEADMYVPNYEKLDMVRKHAWLRRALALAANQPLVAKAARANNAATTDPTYITPPSLDPSMEQYVNKEVLNEVFPYGFGYKPEKAVDILQKHCEGSVEEGWWYPNKKNGKKLGGWRLATVNGWAVCMTTVRVIAKGWSDIGLKTKPVFQDYGTWEQEFLNNTYDFTLLWDASGHRPRPLPIFKSICIDYRDVSPWTGESPINFSRWFPKIAPKIQEAYNQLWQYPFGSEKSIELAKKIENYLIREVPIIPGPQAIHYRMFGCSNWVNWSRKQDPHKPSLFAKGRPITHIFQVQPRAVKTESFELSKGTVKIGEPVVATIKLHNTADVEHSYELNIRKGAAKRGPGPKVIADRMITVKADSTRTVEIPFKIMEPGSYNITVDDWRIDKYDPGKPRTKTLIVEEAGKAMISPTNLTLSKAEVEPGESTTISVDVSNEGNAKGSKTIEITLDGETVKSETVTLEPGETTTVSATTSKSAEGTYTVKAGELTRTFTVKKREVVIPPGLEDKVTLAIRMAENARNAAVGAGSSAQAAKTAANEAKKTAQAAVDAANSAQSTAQEAKAAAQEAKAAAQEAKAAAQEAGGASTSMVIASMLVTIIVVLAGVYVITGKRAT